MEHFPYIELRGDPYEIGRGHGERFQEAIHLQLRETLGAASHDAGMGWAQALDWSAAQLPKGVAVFANAIWARADRNWQAPPLTRRAMLECASAEEAAERIRAMDGPAVGSFLVIDRSGRVRNLEILPQAQAVIARNQGVLVHTNHCLDASLLSHEADQTPAPGSPARCARAQALLEAAAGRVSVERLRTTLADHAGRPEPICRHASSDSAWETASCLTADLGARTLLLSYGPPWEGRFVAYQVS